MVFQTYSSAVGSCYQEKEPGTLFASSSGAHRSPCTITLITDPNRWLRVRLTSGTAARREGNGTGGFKGRSGRRMGREGKGQRQRQELLKLWGKTGRAGEGAEHNAG